MRNLGWICGGNSTSFEEDNRRCYNCCLGFDVVEARAWEGGQIDVGRSRAPLCRGVALITIIKRGWRWDFLLFLRFFG